MIFEANMDKHKVKTTYFFRLIIKGERDMAGETFIGSSGLWG